MSKLYPLIFVILCFSCQKTSSEFVSSGNWGGEHIRLVVNDDSWYIEFDCAHMMVEGSVLLTDGIFEKQASYVQEYGVQFDDESLYKPKPGKIYGEVDGEKMILNVEVEDQQFGTFNLIYDKEAKIYKCA